MAAACTKNQLLEKLSGHSDLEIDDVPLFAELLERGDEQLISALKKREHKSIDVIIDGNGFNDISVPVYLYDNGYVNKNYDMFRRLIECEINMDSLVFPIVKKDDINTLRSLTKYEMKYDRRALSACLISRSRQCAMHLLNLGYKPHSISVFINCSGGGIRGLKLDMVHLADELLFDINYQFPYARGDWHPVTKKLVDVQAHETLLLNANDEQIPDLLYRYANPFIIYKSGFEIQTDYERMDEQRKKIVRSYYEKNFKHLQYNITEHISVSRFPDWCIQLYNLVPTD